MSEFSIGQHINNEKYKLAGYGSKSARNSNNQSLSKRILRESLSLNKNKRSKRGRTSLRSFQVNDTVIPAILILRFHRKDLKMENIESVIGEITRKAAADDF